MRSIWISGVLKEALHEVGDQVKFPSNAKDGAWPCQMDLLYVYGQDVGRSWAFIKRQR